MQNEILYKQRRDFDCVLACLATIVHRPYEELWTPEFCEKIEEKRGTYGATLEEAFETVGLIRNEDYWCVGVPETSLQRFVQRMLFGRRAMLQVPSLNNENGQHAIYWNGSEIHDPSNKQVYMCLSSCSPVNIWIFNERK